MRKSAGMRRGAFVRIVGVRPDRGFMKRFAAIVVLTSVLGACSPDGDATGSATSCATKLYPTYNPKALDQCVAVCQKCDHGTPATCNTSCSLKGAR